MAHKEWESLSAFLDGELAPGERAEIEAHLASCSACSKELAGFRKIKEGSAAALRRRLPADILTRLETELSSPPWTRRLVDLFRLPWVALPVGAAAALAVSLLFWTARPGEEEIPLEPLLAAHTRYSAEGLLYQEDLAHPEFVAGLVSDHAK